MLLCPVVLRLQQRRHSFMPLLEQHRLSPSKTKSRDWHHRLMKITCSDYWPRDESWWPHVPSEGNKSGDVSGGAGNRKVDIQVTSQWHGETEMGNVTAWEAQKNPKLRPNFRSQLSQREKMVNQTSVPRSRCTPPLIANCCQAGISHGITHQAWISHS